MSLPWIKVYGSLFEHPRAIDLGDELDQPMAWAHLVALWSWCAEYAPTGTVSGRNPERAIERAARWTGEAGRFVEAAVATGWLDRRDDGFRVCGWDEHQKAHIEKAEKDRKRAAETYAKSRESLREESRETPKSLSGERRGEEKREELLSGKPDAPVLPFVAPPTDEKPSAPDREGTITRVLTRWRERAEMPKATIEGKAAKDRRRRIAARLDEGWTEPRLLAVLDGFVCDGFLMGTDPKSKPGGYRDVETVFRDNAQCERLEKLAEGPAQPRPLNFGRPDAQPPRPLPPPVSEVVKPLPARTPESDAARDKVRNMFGPPADRLSTEEIQRRLEEKLKARAGGAA